MLDSSDPRRRTQLDLQAIEPEALYLNKLPPHQVLRLNAAGTLKEFPGESQILEAGGVRPLP